MAKLGAGSLAKLGECHPDLQRLVHAVVKRLPAPYDLTVLCGWRNKVEQDAAYARGASKLKYPESKHNKVPSLAVDLGLYPYEPKDVKAAAFLAGFVFAVAADLGISVRWGNDWNRNGKTIDETFHDLPHFELS